VLVTSLLLLHGRALVLLDTDHDLPQERLQPDTAAAIFMDKTPDHQLVEDQLSYSIEIQHNHGVVRQRRRYLFDEDLMKSVGEALRPVFSHNL
jgi:hypothetical protein